MILLSNDGNLKNWALFTIIPALVWMMAGYVRAGEAPGLLLQVEPAKQIFSSREGLVTRFTFKAQSKTKLCLDKDILSQVQVTISRSGTGKLPLKPLVIKDNSQIFQEPMKVVWLEAGQSLTLRANLKRYQFDGAEQWIPGEYSIGATFNLCEQTPAQNVTDPGRETSVPSQRQGWFMIMS